MEMKRREYIVTLKDGSKMRIYFIGDHLEKIFNSYGVKYEKVKEEK